MLFLQHLFLPLRSLAFCFPSQKPLKGEEEEGEGEKKEDENAKDYPCCRAEKRKEELVEPRSFLLLWKGSC